MPTSAIFNLFMAKFSASAGNWVNHSIKGGTWFLYLRDMTAVGPASPIETTMP